VAVLTDTLTKWMKGFNALNAACAQVNANVPNLTLNSFANASLASLLPNAGNVVAFSKYVKVEFTKAGLTGWKLPQPLDTSRTFVNLMTFPLWHSLFYSVMLYVQTYCPPTCVDANNNLVLATPLSIAFPQASVDPGWTKLTASIAKLKFYQVLPAGALAASVQQVTPPSQATLSDLITTLSTT
jgi:hypothetical protein